MIGKVSNRDKEYILLGSDNKWYGFFSDMTEVLLEIAKLRDEGNQPEVLYILKAQEINRVYKDN